MISFGCGSSSQIPVDWYNLETKNYVELLLSYFLVRDFIGDSTGIFYLNCHIKLWKIDNLKNVKFCLEFFYRLKCSRALEISNSNSNQPNFIVVINLNIPLNGE